MSQYSIKAVAHATGLTVETLRAWERRYEVVRPGRDPSGRRAYSAGDVARLRLLRAATDLGHPISRLAALNDESLAKLLADANAAPRSSQSRAQAVVERVLEAAAHYDASGVEETLALAIAVLPPSEVVNGVLGPVLREVGNRWHSGEFSIAQEHLVSDVVRRMVSSVNRTYLRGEQAPALVFATLSNERHDLGLLLCAWLAASRRLRCHYLGSDLPAAEIARYAREVEAHAVILSLVMPDASVGASEQLAELCKALGDACPVWIGGGAAREIDASALPAGCVHVPSQSEFEHRLEMLAATTA